MIPSLSIRFHGQPIKCPNVIVKEGIAIYSYNIKDRQQGFTSFKTNYFTVFYFFLKRNSIFISSHYSIFLIDFFHDKLLKLEQFIPHSKLVCVLEDNAILYFSLIHVGSYINLKCQYLVVIMSSSALDFLLLMQRGKFHFPFLSIFKERL